MQLSVEVPPGGRVSGRRVAGLVAHLVVAVLVLTACAAPPPPETENVLPQRDTSEENLAAIRAIISDFMSTYNAADVDAFSGLFTEDAIRMPPNAPAIVGRQRIRENMITTFATFDGEVTVNQEEVRFSGDFAITRGTWALTLTPKSGGEAQSDVGKWLTMIERQEDGSWKIARNIWNSDRPLDS